MNIDECINLDDLRKMAKRRVPKLIYDFIEGGVDDESGLVRNEGAFARRGLMPKYMAGSAPIDRSTTIFGKNYSSPFGISPMGGIGNYRRGGDLMLARAARNANIPFILSGAATAAISTEPSRVSRLVDAPLVPITNSVPLTPIKAVTVRTLNFRLCFFFRFNFRLILNLALPVGISTSV